MSAHIRRRWVNERGEKRQEWALSRRDDTPRFAGEPAPRTCSYCREGLPHSTELHEYAARWARKAGPDAGVAA